MAVGGLGLMLLSPKMEEGARSQGLWSSFQKLGKGKEMILPQGLQKERGT